MDGDRPLISVIIPTFNREEHIGRCLDSVVTESFDDYQVVVVDNASTDDTAGVAGRYVDRMDLEIVVNDVNHERSFSRNRGAEIAGGRYLLFLDSDDELTSGALERAAEFIAGDPDRLFFFQNLRIIDGSGGTVYRPKVGRGTMDRVLAEGNPLSCSGVYVERELFLRHRFDEDSGLVGSEDWHCWIRVAAEHLPRICPGEGALLVDHSGRTSSVDSWRSAERRFARLTASLLQDGAACRFLAPNIGLFRATQAHYVAVMAAGQGHLMASMCRFGRSLRHHPRLLFSRRTAHLVRLWLRVLKPARVSESN